MSLTPKQARFAAEYVVDLNGKQAAIRAGYAPKGAEATASTLIRKPKVKAEKDRLVSARQERTEITQDRAVRELAYIALADPREVVTWDDHVTLRPSDDISAAAAATVAEVAETQHGIRVKFHSKLSALDLLGRHLGMFKGEEGGNVKDAARALADAFAEMAAADGE